MQPDDWLVQELQLTEGQQQAFDELRTAYLEKRRANFREVRNLRRQMIDELEKEGQEGRTKAEAILPQIMEYKLQSEKLFLDHYQELQKVCDPEQQKKLKEIFMRMNRSKKRHDHKHKKQR